jgi:hypothetical protein
MLSLLIAPAASPRGATSAPLRAVKASVMVGLSDGLGLLKGFYANV